MSYSSEVLADSPAAYYRMNETAAMQTAVLDDGFGGNEDPIAINWSGPWYPGVGQMQRLSNQIAAPSSAQGGSWYDLATFGPACEVYVTIAALGATGNDLQLYARMQNPGTTNLSGYILIFEPRGGGGDFFRMYREDNGSDTLLDLDDTITWGDGDKIALRCIGSNIQGWRQPSGGEWERILDATDATYSTAGYFGIGSSVGTFAFTNFGGGTVTSTSNLPRDSSGNGNHATIVEGVPVYSQTGAIASDSTDAGVLFTASPLQNFRVPDSATLDFGNVFTLEAWIKRSDFSAAEYAVFSKGYGTNFGAGMYLQNNKLSGAQAGIGFFVESASTVPNDGNYYHCVVTKNGSTRLTYINGVDVTNTGAQGDLTCENTVENLGLGGELNFNTTSGAFAGTLAEVAIYPTALSAARVLAHYTAAVTSAGTALRSTRFMDAIGW